MLVLVVTAVLLLLVLVYWRNRKPAHIPPGEWGWPIVGKLPKAGVAMDELVKDLRKKHGNIFTWRIGSQVFVVVTEFQLIKKVFSLPEVQGRGNFFSIDVFANFSKEGLFNSSGEVWQEGRRFIVRHLRDLGMGKSSLESAICYETRCVVDDFAKYTDKPVEVPWSLNVAILNIIWKMVADIRYEVEDPKIQEFQKMIFDIFEGSQGRVLLFDSFPFLVPIIPNFMLRLMGVQEYIDNCNRLQKYIEKVVEDHKATHDPDNTRDFIDYYLKEVQLNAANPRSVFTMNNLNVSVVDLFAGGSESTSSTIKWIILYMACYPDVQAKVHAEIDDVVPKDRLPDLDDRPKLNYSEAVFHEVQRIISFTPLGVGHRVMQDVSFGGYTLPKESVVIAHLENCHKDPAYWEKPMEFHPEHFLDEKGHFKQKKEGYVPFSIGRRVCPGESLAKMQIYLITSAILQNYSFRPPSGVTLSLDRDPSQTLIMMPKPFKVVITKRK